MILRSDPGRLQELLAAYSQEEAILRKRLTADSAPLRRIERMKRLAKLEMELIPRVVAELQS